MTQIIDARNKIGRVEIKYEMHILYLHNCHALHCSKQSISQKLIVLITELMMIHRLLSRKHGVNGNQAMLFFTKM